MTSAQQLVSSFIGRGINFRQPHRAIAKLHLPPPRTRTCNGKNVRRIRQWLAQAQPGDTMNYHTLGLGHRAIESCKLLVASGELIVQQEATRGEGGRAAVFAKPQPRNQGHE